MFAQIVPLLVLVLFLGMVAGFVLLFFPRRLARQKSTLLILGSLCVMMLLAVGDMAINGLPPETIPETVRAPVVVVTPEDMARRGVFDADELDTRDQAKASIALIPMLESIALAGIEGYPEVLHAVITQDGAELSLVIVVPAGTSVVTARQLGEHFVRTVKALAKGEPTPTKDVGSGIYNYSVRVTTLDREVIAMGAKVSTSSRLTW